MHLTRMILGFLVALLLASNVSATTWSLSEDSPLGEIALDAAVEPAAHGLSANLLRGN